MNKGKINNHTRNQKRMYRIHKQEELIEKQRYIIGDLQQRIDTAIRYIDCEGYDVYFKDEDKAKTLLQILNGEYE